MAHIDYYLSTISPWCYLAGNRLEEIAARHVARITYRPLDMVQLLARTGGTRLAERHPSRQDYRLQELRRWRTRLDRPMLEHPLHVGTNTAPSSYAIIAAQEAGGDVGALVQGFLRAAWEEDRNIADDGVIREVLEAAGFDPKLADSGLFVGAEHYSRNLEDAVTAGVFGVPFYIVRETGEKFWGQDRLDMLDNHLA